MANTSPGMQTGVGGSGGRGPGGGGSGGGGGGGTENVIAEAESGVGVDFERQWLHCNHCFNTSHSSPSLLSPILSFYISQCSHILCRNCVTFNNNNVDDESSCLNHVCPVCGLTGALLILSQNV
jgi:hypothetical protein